MDPRTNEGDCEVHHILHLHKIIQALPDAFMDASEMTQSHIPATNVLARIAAPGSIVGDHQPRQKYGRPIGSKDSHP